ncbi:MAG: 2OG-Fe(II) oxygenase [Pseudonocardiaceae bacterium]
MSVRVSLSGHRYVVIDEVLPDSDAETVWQAFQALPMKPSERGSNARRLDDGDAYHGVSKRFAVSDIGSAGTSLAQTVLSGSALAAPVIGAAGTEWTSFTLMPWRYPAGGQLGWHNDGDSQGSVTVAAYVWYVHRFWSASWSGDLLLLDEPADAVRARAKYDLEVAIMLADDPVCVLAKPNRLVLFKSDTYHMVRRVDRTAGNRHRSSFTGFF